MERSSPDQHTTTASRNAEENASFFELRKKTEMGVVLMMSRRRRKVAGYLNMNMGRKNSHEMNGTRTTTSDSPA